MPLLPDLPKAEIAIIEQTNVCRQSSRIGAVASETVLTKAAREYARFLAAAPVFSHEADGRRPADRIKAAGYAACTTAENLAWMLDSRGFDTHELATKMVEGWKNSPPHRKNLLIEHITDTGVALAKVRNAEKYIGVQLFGRPQSKLYEFEIRNTAGRSVAYTVAGKRTEVANNQSVRTTLCEPSEMTLEIKAAGLLSKPEVKHFKTGGGQLYRVSRDPGGAVRVDVEIAAGKN